MMVPKFRAWNGYRKIMADYISAIQNGETLGTPSSVNVIVNGKNETWDIENDHVELLQYTGLKDKNGKDVYEGDLLKIKYPFSDNDEIGEVKWSNSDAAFIIGNFQFWKVVPKSVVVGNIHEDKDLLEADK